MDVHGMFERLLEGAGTALAHLEAEGESWFTRGSRASFDLSKVVTADGKYVPDGAAQRTADSRPEKCPRCGSPDPRRHPATAFEGEVQPCPDPWHGSAPMIGGLPPSDAAREQAARADLAELELARARDAREELDRDLRLSGRLAERDRIIAELRNAEHGDNTHDRWAAGWRHAIAHIENMTLPEATT